MHKRSRPSLKPKPFVTFEGGEGAGKSTLIDAVAKTLEQEGIPFLKAREPGGTPLGEAVRSLLLNRAEMPIVPHAELLLFLAARAQQIHDVIIPALRAGKIVLCDRFNDSSIAYQGVARGLGVSVVSTLCEFAVQGVQPDLTIYLDIDPALGLTRAKRERAHDRIESETLAFHTKIREGYLALCQQEPHRMHRIDATQPRSVVLAQAMAIIHARLKRHV